MAPAHGERRGATEPVRVSGRRALEGTVGGAAAHVHTRPEAPARISPPDSKEVYYLDRGRGVQRHARKREPKANPVSAELDVDFSPRSRDYKAWTYCAISSSTRSITASTGTPCARRISRGWPAPVLPTRCAASSRMMLGRAERVAHGILGAAQATQTTLGRLARFRFVGIREKRTAARGRRHPLGPAALGGLKAGELPPAGDGVMSGTL